MNLRSTKGLPRPDDVELIPIGERCMALLLEGIAMNVPAVEPDSYREFRSNVGRLALQVPEPTSEDEKLILTRTLIQEFETYNKAAETCIRDTQAAWQGLLNEMFTQLLTTMGIPSGSPEASELLHSVRNLKLGNEVRDWRTALEKFLDPLGPNAAQGEKSALRQTNQSTANDNAAGLLGGGKAMEQIRGVMERKEDGFVVLFQLRCMEIISQRFGIEAVQDCLMAVSSFLTSGLQGNDKIYHWSDSSLLAVLQNRPNEGILNAEVSRILAQNRESTIKVAGRPIMLRIPLAFDIIPLSRLRSPEDLLRLTGQKPKM